MVHFGVTYHPTDNWVAQQLREATPFGEGPKFIILDKDNKYASQFERLAAASRIRVLRTPYRAPKANAFCERLIGSIRRECLDHVLVLGKGHLARVLGEYVRFYNAERPHQGLRHRVPARSNAPLPRPRSPRSVRVRASTVLGGLHHAYEARG